MSPVTPPGRLTLSWVGKEKALIDTAAGGYEWVNRDDPRVAEVRLLRERDAVGVTEPGRVGNLLVVGDAHEALLALIRVPEYAQELRGKVKLVYIDPPFNTGQAFAQYDDALEHSVWLTMMRDRLLLIRELLAPDGSVWVHLDDAEMAYCRVLMDEIFGRANFVSTIVWQKVYSPRMDARQFSSSHDYIMVYSRTSGWTPNSFVVEPDLTQFRHTDINGRRYRSDPLRKWGKNSARADRPNLWYPITAPNGIAVWPIRPDGTEGNWRWGSDTYEKRREELDWLDKGYGLQPYVRQYADMSTTRPPETLWASADVGHNHEAQEHLKTIFGTQKFATPKPERLLERVIHIATKPGDIVVDCFAGSGTTAAVAHKMGRRWVTVEKERSTVDLFTQPRLEKVVAGEDGGGVTAAVGWKKGGGFRVAEVGPSLYELQAGRAYLADWATNGRFAEAVAAQLGFRVDHDAPFSGRKGRSRLAVIDGVIDGTVVRAVVSRLGDDERTVLVGKGATPDAADLLGSLSPGSRLRKAPRDLLTRGVVR